MALGSTVTKVAGAAMKIKPKKAVTVTKKVSPKMKKKVTY